MLPASSNNDVDIDIDIRIGIGIGIGNNMAATNAVARYRSERECVSFRDIARCACAMAGREIDGGQIALERAACTGPIAFPAREICALVPRRMSVARLCW